MIINTQEYLKSILNYDPETGVFIWKISCNKNYMGKQAGCIDITRGYVKLTFKKKTYLMHRLAWLWMTGKWPTKLIDHKDCDPSNNRWSNLREATSQENNRNKRSKNKIGIKGIILSPNGKYRVILALGSFDTLEEAKKVYENAVKELHGEFLYKSAA